MQMMTRSRAEALEAERTELLAEAERAIQAAERSGGRQTAAESEAFDRTIERVEAIDREREGVADPRRVSGVERLGRIAHVLHLAATQRNGGLGGGIPQVARDAFHDPRFVLEVRAVTAPALTTVPAWAGALAGELRGEILDQARANSVLGALFGDGIPTLTGGGSIRWPRRTAGAPLSGGWVGEGLPIPVKASSFTSFALGPKKAAGITAASKEMLRATGLAGALGAMMVADVRETIDRGLCDNAAASATRPAGLLNGDNATPIAATAGGGVAAIVGDFAALLAAHLGAGASLATSAWLLPGTAFAVMAKHAEFAAQTNELKMAGLPLIVSPFATASSLAIVDKAQLVAVYGEDFNVELSGNATLMLDDAPTAPGQVTSLYQLDMSALKTTIAIDWHARAATAIHATTGTTWS